MITRLCVAAAAFALWAPLAASAATVQQVEQCFTGCTVSGAWGSHPIFSGLSQATSDFDLGTIGGEFFGETPVLGFQAEYIIRDQTGAPAQSAVVNAGNTAEFQFTRAAGQDSTFTIEVNALLPSGAASMVDVFVSSQLVADARFASDLADLGFTDPTTTSIVDIRADLGLDPGAGEAEVAEALWRDSASQVAGLDLATLPPLADVLADTAALGLDPDAQVDDLLGAILSEQQAEAAILAQAVVDATAAALQSTSTDVAAALGLPAGTIAEVAAAVEALGTATEIASSVQAVVDAVNAYNPAVGANVPSLIAALGMDDDFNLDLALISADSAETAARLATAGFVINGQQVGIAPIPLPAGGWLLLAALGGLGVWRRRAAA